MRLPLLLTQLALWAVVCLPAAAQALKLHVPSPDWREQIIYFVMTDRFADGDVRNNDQGAGEYDPKSFDHVLFSIFIELPGRTGGATLMPLQQAELPGGMRWHVRLRAHGWTNAVFGPKGADASHDGEALIPAPEIPSNAAERSVTFTIPSATLGHPQSLSGARVYVTTWDCDGGLRAIAREPGPFTMGHRGSDDPAKVPRVMDAAAVITLP